MNFNHKLLFRLKYNKPSSFGEYRDQLVDNAHYTFVSIRLVNWTPLFKFILNNKISNLNNKTYKFTNVVYTYENLQLLPNISKS